ncbi:MAG TPA: hypothetical protein VIH45_12820 [Desulfuromonadaceae bacterium]
MIVILPCFPGIIHDNGQKYQFFLCACRGEQHDPTLPAVASEEPLEQDVPVLDLNDPKQVADFVETTFLRTLHQNYKYVLIGVISYHRCFQLIRNARRNDSTICL